MDADIGRFMTYLEECRKASKNTMASYQRDLCKCVLFLQKQGLERLSEASATNLTSYVLYLEREGFASATVSRSIASMKAFYQYLLRCAVIAEDPSGQLKPPKVERRIPVILTTEEINCLLSLPDVTTSKGIRDQAMLELLYATGMRVSELLRLKAEDVNLDMNYLICRSNGRERIIPFENAAKKALLAYQAQVDSAMEEPDAYLFTNRQGKPMTRQGFWKIMKYYAEKAGIEKDITPHMIRHSVAMHLVENGADLKSVQEILGHCDISSTQIYASAAPHTLKEVYDRAHPRR